MIYLGNLADKFNLDPIKCAKDEIQINANKYSKTTNIYMQHEKICRI